MIKHVIVFLCITIVLTVSGILFADFGAADCIAAGIIVLSVYAAALHTVRRKKRWCGGCSGCAEYEKCQKRERRE